MNNKEFLEVVKNSYIKYLETNSRSTEKLKILHGEIIKDIEKKLKIINNDFKVFGLGDSHSGKEKTIIGRYTTKKTDVTIVNKKEIVAGIAVKFVMSNYKQNGNNYFENMLGETANIRTNNTKYFQVFIVFDELPYFKKNGEVKKWEVVYSNNVKKYFVLSSDDSRMFFHTPDKTLLIIVHVENFDIIKKQIKSKKDIKSYFLNNDFHIKYSDVGVKFKNGLIFNDYERFVEKIIFSIQSI